MTNIFKVAVKKKKQKNQLESESNAAMMMMSPSSATSASSSTSSTNAKAAKGKKSRQTIAALAAAAAATTTSSNPTILSVQPTVTLNHSTATNPVDLQRNLVALAQLAAQNSQANQTCQTAGQTAQITTIDSIINEMSKSQTPKPVVSKHLKKQHLLSASLNNTPVANGSITNIPQMPATAVKEKKSYIKKNKLLNTGENGIETNNALNNNVVAPTPAVAAALQHLYNNNLNSPKAATPQKPLFNANNNTENIQKMQQHQQPQQMKYDDDDVNGAALMNANMEFECQACEKKFKYYCYYKRHMDACHSDAPKYICDICNKSYKWEASFRQHLRSHHNQHPTATQLIPSQNASQMEQGEEDAEYDDDEDEIEMRNELKINENYNNHQQNASEMLTIEPVTTTIVTTENEDEEGEEGEVEDRHDEDQEEYDDDVDTQEDDNNTNNEHNAAASTLASIADSINAAIKNNIMI